MESDRQPDGENASSESRAVLVLGAAGQLGSTVASELAAAWPVVGLTRDDLDVVDSAAVARRVADLHPWAIVNCVAYNLVDEAEDQPIVALETNALAVRTLARAAARAGATLVHYSTDFVFDGEAGRAYGEDDRPNPRSVYAASKLMGEWFAADAGPHYVLRVESLFGGRTRHKSSLDRIVEAIARGAPVRAFTDRTVTPSYAWDVAAATAHLLRTRPADGLYHCVNSGAATWFDVAAEVRRQTRSDAVIEPITTDDVALRAARPRYCALANDKLRAAGAVLPAWQDALHRHLAQRPGTADRAATAGSTAITEKTEQRNG